MAFNLPLAKGLSCLIDEVDAPRVTMHRWAMRRTGRPYVGGSIKDASGAWRSVLLHRFILDAPPGRLVDHIDGNSLNNTRANLRIASPKQNAANRRGAISGRFLGVSACATGFKAMVYPHGMSIFLGIFADEEAAADAYNQAAAAAFKEFASRNDVPHYPGLLEDVITVKREAIARLQQEIQVLGGGNG
jgi:hypothetical protein